MPPGAMGKVLWVDLSHGTINEEHIPDSVYRRFLSGVGLAAYLLYREIPPGAEPLGPENVLGFVSGLLNGTNSLFTGRWMAVGKSPLTGAWGEANCGGTLASAIKRSGYDGIFFKGTSPRPVYLSVINGQAKLQDAGDLWGRDTIETDQRLRAAYPNTAVACIGPAGERLSLIAAISNDGGRMAARSGLGAVMGAKRLKAVVLAGNQKMAIHDKEEMQHLSQKALRFIRLKVPLPPGKVTRYIGTLMRVLPFQWAQDGMLYKWLLQRWGTISMNQISVEMGDAPIQNWRGTSADFPFRRSDSSNPDLITRYETKKYHCRACALGCGGTVSVPKSEPGRPGGTVSVPKSEPGRPGGTVSVPMSEPGRFGETASNGGIQESHKPEYETVLAWGGLLLNEDLESIFAINERLNRAGMDSISAGGTVAFAIECAERGLFTAEQLDGLDLKWGNSQAIQALLERMITREGIGDLLADGSHAAAARLGHGAETYAVQAGGQELAMHDGRNDPGFALHAVVEPMPGRHTNGSQLYYEMFQLWTRVSGLPRAKRLYGKASKYAASGQQVRDLATAAVACSRFSQVMNGAGLCLFGGFVGVQRLPIFEWLNAATGWQETPDAYMQTGARIQALKQLFNARQGLPPRHTINLRAIGVPPQLHGANRGRSLDIDSMVREYWTAAGWDAETGLPGEEMIKELELLA